MKCLLCGQTMKAVLTFSSLLLLKNDVSCLCLDCDSTFERIGEENCSKLYENRFVNEVSRLSILV